jgi:sugar/nucleoside kinase (ribokinase family)
MLSDPGANAALSPEDLPRDLFSGSGHLHMSGYTLMNEGSRDAGLAALEMARRSGMTISVDCASSAPLDRTGAEPFLEWTNGTKLLFANADQAKVLTGRDEPAAAAKVLTAWFPQVVIKLNTEGALWYTNNRADPVRSPAEIVDRVVDGTGAGDAFTAGFLPQWLANKPPAESLAAGNALAAKCISNLGARPRL